MSIYRKVDQSLHVPKSQGLAFGNEEQIRRRRDAEDGSYRLLRAIRRYLERRA